MNILDENIPEGQRHLLRSWRVQAKQIGHDIGRQGMKDEEIIPFLHQLHHTTFFTRDAGFYYRQLSHANYCLVILGEIQMWQLYAENEEHIKWLF